MSEKNDKKWKNEKYECIHTASNNQEKRLFFNSKWIKWTI